MELHNARGQGMNAAAISWSDLAAWSAMRGVTLSPWELDSILALDRIALTTLQTATPAQTVNPASTTRAAS